MVSDFISEQDGYLKLSNQEFATGPTIFPGLKQHARAYTEYGENKDGYWTSDKFTEQLEYSVKIGILYGRKESKRRYSVLEWPRG